MFYLWASPTSGFTHCHFELAPQMFAPLLTAPHNCRFLVSIKSERMSLYNNSATFGVERVIENKFRNYFLCWKCLAPTDVIFISCDGIKWRLNDRGKGRNANSGFISVFVWIWFSEKKQSLIKEQNLVNDRWQTDCQVKTVSSKGDKYRLNIRWQVQLLFCTFGNTQPLIPSSVFRDKPSNASRSFIHSGLLRTFFCTGFCLDPIVPQT